MKTIFALVTATLLAAPLSARDTPQIAVTIDDLPVHGALPPAVTRAQVARQAIAALQAAHAGAVYGFVNAGNVLDADTRAVLALWREAGLPLGNHGWSHADLARVGAPAFLEDVARDAPVLDAAMGKQDWHWLRFPFLQEGGDTAQRLAVRAELARQHYRIAAVTMSFGDYDWTAPYARCAAQQNDTAIAWLHDSYLAAARASATQSRAQARRVYGRDIPYVLLVHIGAFTARMLPELLAQYRHDGFGFTTLPQAEADPAYAADMNPALAPVTSLATRAGDAVPPTHDYSAELAAICQPPA